MNKEREVCEKVYKMIEDCVPNFYTGIGKDFCKEDFMEKIEDSLSKKESVKKTDLEMEEIELLCKITKIVFERDIKKFGMLLVEVRDFLMKSIESKLDEEIKLEKPILINASDEDLVIDWENV